MVERSVGNEKRRDERKREREMAIADGERMKLG